MAKRPRTKWYVVVTAEDGGTLMYGGWYDFEKASKVSDQLRDYSGHYGGPGPVFEVDVLNSEPWPGIRAFKEGDQERSYDVPACRDEEGNLA